MSETPLPESDRLDGAPHPRETPEIFGQDAAKDEFLRAYNAGRLHHAWLLSGPKGVGKATLAWRIARFLLEQPVFEAEAPGLFGEEPAQPTSLDFDPNSPLSSRITALSEPRLFLMRRSANDKGDRLSNEIRVQDVRALNSFFALSSTDGGRRVVIVDSMDEMNVSAANALLKMLEEPPEHVTLLLISHQPAKLLPTIRSRCRTLRLNKLESLDLTKALAGLGQEEGNVAMALAALSDGSVGTAFGLTQQEGLKTYATLLGIADAQPGQARFIMTGLADHAAARGQVQRLDVLTYLIDMLLSRLARTGAGHPPAIELANGEIDLLRRLSPSPGAARDWAELQTEIAARISHGRAVNLDPAALILDTLIRINETAGMHRTRA